MKRGLRPLKEYIMRMRATISIEFVSVPRLGAMDYRDVPLKEFHMLIAGCHKLLEQLGPLAKNVEVIKIVPWHGRPSPTRGDDNLFDVRVVLSMSGEDHKLEIVGTFGYEKSGSTVFSTRFVQDMERKIHSEVHSRMRELKHRRERWEKLVPAPEPKY